VFGPGSTRKVFGRSKGMSGAIKFRENRHDETQFRVE
jgi:hypothetical protein